MYKKIFIILIYLFIGLYTNSIYSLAPRSAHTERKPNHEMRENKWNMYDITKDELSSLAIGVMDEYLSYSNTNLSVLTTYACNVKCGFCVAGIKYPTDGDIKTDKVEFKCPRYFSNLKRALAQVIPELNPTVSLTGGEPTMDPKLPEILKILKEFKVRKRVITTNGGFLLKKLPGRDKTVLDYLIDYDLEHLNISHAHYDEDLNAKMMPAPENSKYPTPSTEELREIVRKANEKGIRIRLSCIVTKQGIGTFDEMKNYIEWAKSIGVDNVVFRELMKYDPNYAIKSDITDYIDNNSLSVEPFYEKMEADPEFRFVNQVLGYYYYVEVYNYKGVDVVVESADLKQMEKEKLKPHFNEKQKIYELVIHPDGSLSNSWRKNKEILLSPIKMRRGATQNLLIKSLEQSKTIGERIKNLLWFYELSNEELSFEIFKDKAKSNIIENWINNSNKPTPKEFKDLAELFFVEPSLIIKGKTLKDALNETYTLGNKIKLLRQVKGLTRKELEDIIFTEPTEIEKESVTQDEWNESLGNAWNDILKHYDLPKNGVVIEIAPGTMPKIGLGLKKYDFSGTIYIVEPDKKALDSIIQTYKTLIPKATIIPVQLPVSDCLNSLPKMSDAILSNHCLDDMILGKSLQDKEFQNLFADPHGEIDSLEMTIKYWKSLNQNPTKRFQFQYEVLDEWKTLLDKLNPRFFALAQYPSWGFKGANYAFPDYYAGLILNDLKNYTNSNSIVELELKQKGFDSSRWLTNSIRPINLDAKLNKIPQASKRLGEETFIPVMSYNLPKDKTETFYYQSDLLGKYFHNNVPWVQIARQINDKFSLNLEENDKKYGVLKANIETLVDFQKDYTEAGELGVSMRGNLGSGRAFYIGDIFNIKGAKTPLATSKDERHNDGILDMETGIWETIISNSLYRNLRTGTSPVAALIDTNRLYSDKYTDDFDFGTEVLLLRLDNGLLDRPTHLHHNKKSLSKKELLKMAKQFGEHEAEKFIERIHHGCWSAGNISLNGEMLDYETVRSVDNRAPQTLGTIYFKPNLFGLEIYGQLNVLNNILMDKNINKDNVNLKDIKEELFEAYNKQIKIRFLDLMGFDIILKDKVLNIYEQQINRLSSNFDLLSRKMYPRFDALDTHSKTNSELALFDFSRFFRYYPILKRSNKWSIENALALLINGEGELKELDKEGFPETLKKDILSGGYIVSNQKELERLYKKALDFISDYDSLFDRLQKSIYTRNDRSIEMKAYLVNENRVYLDSSFGRLFKADLVNTYKRKKLSEKWFNDTLRLLIKANNRIPHPKKEDRYEADIRIYLNGYSGKYLNKNGKFRFFLSLFKEQFTPISKEETLKIIINGSKSPCHIEETKDEFIIISPEFDNSFLLDPNLNFSFLRNEQEIKLDDFNVKPNKSQGMPDKDFSELLNKSINSFKFFNANSFIIAKWETNVEIPEKDILEKLKIFFDVNSDFTEVNEYKFQFSKNTNQKISV